MASYCTAADVKTRLGISSGGDDVLIEAIISAVCQAIDNYTKHIFTATTEEEGETRYFDGPGGTILFLNDDLLDVDTITNDDDELDPEDYILYPLNKFPKRWIELDEDEGEVWAKGRNKIAITGVWGYCEDEDLPRDIWNAAVEWSCRVYKMKDSAYTDATASPELGELIYQKGMPPQVQIVLDHYKTKPVLGSV